MDAFTEERLAMRVPQPDNEAGRGEMLGFTVATTGGGEAIVATTGGCNGCVVVVVVAVNEDDNNDGDLRV